MQTKKITKQISIVAVFFMALFLTDGDCQDLPKTLIITGNGNVPNYKTEYPPWIHEFQNEKVVEILRGITAVDVVSDLSVLEPEQLQQYDLVIGNSIFLTPTKGQLDALYQFVSSGKSYMTLHCGLISLLNWDKYEEFIGGIFIGGPSSVPASFKVVTDNVELWGYQYPFRKESIHPVSIVTHDFVTKDELYHFQPSTRDFNVIARAENLPVMWWHPVGKGKVMSLTLGHDEEAKNNPGYQDLLQKGVQWLLGVPLIYGEPHRTISTRNMIYTDFTKLKTSADDAGSGAVTFRVVENRHPDLATASVSEAGSVSLKLTGKPGPAEFIVLAQNNKGLSSRQSFQLTVVPDGSENLAGYYGNAATASSHENGSSTFAAANMIDNDTTTRWSSAPTESATVVIDLQKTYNVKRIVLQWEASYAAGYNIQTSTDSKTWNVVKTELHGDGATDSIEISPAKVRFVKIVGTQRANKKWGYSLYEVKVFEK